jgi:DNA-directed RNA polymerase II subunit RPB3
MNPTFTNIESDEDILKFTISNINMSFANAIRRIILSEIPCIVFRTTPHENNLAEIEVNTSRLNNEIIKQRLSCVPIHISDINFPYNDHEIHIDVANNGDSVDYVTTKDFKIYNTKTESYLSDEAVREIFPPDLITRDYIILTRLRPKISDNVPGEHLKMKCKLAIGTAKENGSFNVVSTCGFAATPDETKINEKWSQIEKELNERGLSKDEIESKKLDWKYLDAKRITKADSFDFIIESVGIFTNEEIVVRAGGIMLDKLKTFKTMLDDNSLKIEKSKTTMENCYDIILEKEDYTLGKVLENILYEKYYQKTIDFCGFQKPHPHIDMSILRVNFINPAEIEQLKITLEEVIFTANEIFLKITNYFKMD